MATVEYLGTEEVGLSPGASWKYAGERVGRGWALLTSPVSECTTPGEVTDALVEAARKAPTIPDERRAAVMQAVGSRDIWREPEWAALDGHCGYAHFSVAWP